MRWTTRVALTFALLASPLHAAWTQTAAAKRPTRISITALVGSATSRTATDLEAAMSSAGYRDDFGGCSFFLCVPTRPGPESYTHANPSLFSLRYAVNEHYGVEVLLGGAAAGTTSGVSGSEHLDIIHGGTLVAPMVFAGGAAARVSLGPALLRSHWDYRSPEVSNGEVQRARTTSVGLVGSAAVRWPSRSRFFVEGTAQYRAFRPVTVRPERAGRPSGRMSVSHSYLGAGLGLQLR